MIRINLLPYRAARKKENIRREFSIFLILLIGVCAGAVMLSFNMNQKVLLLEQQVSQTKQQLTLYNKKIEEINRIQKNLALLEQKLTVMAGLEKNRQEPFYIFDTLPEKIIERRMWFSSVQLSPTSINIDGVALDNKTVADFMVRLEGLPRPEDEKIKMFSAVNLKSLTQYRLNNKGITLKRFQISCEKQPLTPQPAEGAK